MNDKEILKEDFLSLFYEGVTIIKDGTLPINTMTLSPDLYAMLITMQKVKS